MFLSLAPPFLFSLSKIKIKKIYLKKSTLEMSKHQTPEKDLALMSRPAGQGQNPKGPGSGPILPLTF